MVLSAAARALAKIAAKKRAIAKAHRIKTSRFVKKKVRPQPGKPGYKASEVDVAIKKLKKIEDKKFRTEHAAEIRSFGIVKARNLEARDQRLAEGRSVVSLDSIFGRNLKAVKQGSPEHHARLKHSFKELKRLKATRNLGPTSTEALGKDPMVGPGGSKPLAFGQSYVRPSNSGRSFEIITRFGVSGSRHSTTGGKISKMPGFEPKKWRKDTVYGSNQWTTPFEIDITRDLGEMVTTRITLTPKMKKLAAQKSGDAVETAAGIAAASTWTPILGFHITGQYDKKKKLGRR